MFKLTVYFNIEEIGIWQRFETEFELSVNLTVFELAVSDL